MPIINGKKFAYTKKGISKAIKEAAAKEKAIRTSGVDKRANPYLFRLSNKSTGKNK